MENKIIFIGDSWVTNFIEGNKKLEDEFFYIFWQQKNYEAIFKGSPSRDVQTIIDYWIKFIPHLNSNDIIIIFLPFFGRTRLPLDTTSKNFIHNIFPDIPDYFIGTKNYNPKENFLELWGDNYESDYFEKLLETQNLINSSITSIKNFTEIIESLNKITPCKNLIHCWDYQKVESDVIIYREKLTQILGMWETKNDIFIETKNNFMYENDFHWSHKMNLNFMNFLLKHFHIL